MFNSFSVPNVNSDRVVWYGTTPYHSTEASSYGSKTNPDITSTIRGLLTSFSRHGSAAVTVISFAFFFFCSRRFCHCVPIDGGTNLVHRPDQHTTDLTMATAERETEPLIRKTSSVRFSERVDSSDREEGQIPTPSERALLRTSSSISSYIFQKFTQSERQEALKCEGVGAAAFLIRDAVLGEDNTLTGFYDPYDNPDYEIRNVVSVVCRRLVSYPPLMRVETAFVWLLIFLTFIEPPVWCQDGHLEGSCESLLSMQGIPAGQEEDPDAVSVLYYPNSKSMLLTLNQSRVVEWVCLGVIGLFMLFRFGR